MPDSLFSGVHLVTADSPKIGSIIDGIVNVHAACVLHDGTLATFLPPLSYDQLYQWWEKRVAEVSNGERQIIIYMSNTNDRTTNQGLEAPWKDEDRDWPTISNQASGTELEVSGVVSLATPFSQTGPFRGMVEKLFVHPLHRRKGIAKKVMARLETVAVELGRWSLLLDTTVGSDAEHVYPRLGYERVGVLREYGYHPHDGHLIDEVLYSKDLKKMRRLEE